MPTIQQTQQAAEVKASIWQLLETYDRRGFDFDAVDVALRSISLALAERRGADAPTLLRSMADGLESSRYADNPGHFGPVQ